MILNFTNLSQNKIRALTAIEIKTPVHNENNFIRKIYIVWFANCMFFQNVYIIKLYREISTKFKSGLKMYKSYSLIHICRICLICNTSQSTEVCMLNKDILYLVYTKYKLFGIATDKTKMVKKFMVYKLLKHATQR